MKVLHVMNINAIGGAEKLLLHLLPAMAMQHVTIGCLLFYKQGRDQAAMDIAAALEKMGIMVYEHEYKFMFERAIYDKILQTVSENRYHIIHSHLQYSNLWTSQLKQRKKMAIPVVTTLHGYRDSYQNKYGLRYKAFIKLTPYYWITRFICKSLDGYITISRCLHQFFLTTGLLDKAKNSIIIYHGYKTEGIGTKEIVAPANMAAGPSIAIPGRIIKMKGHRFGMEALRLLIKDYPGASLHIFGAGPEEEHIKELASQPGLQKKVFFYGYVSDLIDRLEKFDIVLIPSLYESFGIVFLDAFAAGVPVVAFDLPAGNEIINDGYNGLLAKPLNSHSLYEKIKELVQNRELWTKTAKNAREELLTKYTVERMAADYISYYSQFVNLQQA